jgi:hypothetical protein
MRKPLALNGQIGESKHNLVIPVKTEFSDHFTLQMASKRHLSHQQKSFFSKQGRKGKSRGTWNYRTMANEWWHGWLGGGIPDQNGQFLSQPNDEHGSHQARTDVIQEEIISKMNAHQERTGASVNAWQKERMACLESKEPTSVDRVHSSGCMKRSLK